MSPLPQFSVNAGNIRSISSRISNKECCLDINLLKGRAFVAESQVLLLGSKEANIVEMFTISGK